MSKDIILILDEEPHTQWTLKTFLENENYIVIAVDTIRRAEKNFSEFKISAFITECINDYSQTLEIIKKLKSLFPETYVMMLTNRDLKEEDYEKAIRSGIDDYFVKTVSIHKVLLHLKKGLEKRHLFLEKQRLEQELRTLKKMSPIQHGLERILCCFKGIGKFYGESYGK